MTLRTRLKRLENLVNHVAFEEKRQEDLSEEDWLERFESWGREGFLDGEPDYPEALAFYRAALQTAKAQAAPPWDPPDDFLPRADEHYRRFEWRHGGTFERVDADGHILPQGTDVNRGLVRRFPRFPEVRQGWRWLAGMVKRRIDGVPPVSIAEFERLAAWFVANQDRLLALSQPSCLLEVGKGRNDSVLNLRCQLDEGPRAWNAGAVAEQLRHLRARYGEA
jgi:hypothetical protein